MAKKKYYTVCSIHPRYKKLLVNLGGELMRQDPYDGLCDIQFTSDKFMVIVYINRLRVININTNDAISFDVDKSIQIHVN